MLCWGPSEPLQEHLTSFLPRAVWAHQPPGFGAGQRLAGRWAAPSQPAHRESALPSPGSGERLEHKAIFIYDSVSGLASV